MDALKEQLTFCRDAFGRTRCDVFIHTWSTLHKAFAFHVYGSALAGNSNVSRNPTAAEESSSWSCVSKLQEVLAAASVTVEDQVPPSASRLAAVRPWGNFGENLLNMRMQMASVHGGIQLMVRHASAMGIEYQAVARMRADLGDPTYPQSTRTGVFLTRSGWKTLRRRADLLARGALPARASSELVICGHPRFKHTDFCQWSVPPTPLQRTVERLVGQEAFDALIYRGEGLGGAADCASYLNSTSRSDAFNKFRLPLVSENVLYCAMRAAGVVPSTVVDVKPNSV